MENLARPGLHRFLHPAGFPILAATGPHPGPCLVATAGVHGDEYEGVRALFETWETLDVSALHGSFIAVPIVNLPAHRAVSRVHPLDRKNLARVFPGDPQGSPSEQLAHALAHDVIARADFYLDLHSGGLAFSMPSMAGYDATDPRGEAAAAIFGAPVIWGHPLIEAGRTISFARSRNIPFLYTEAFGAGRIAPADLAMQKRGLRNLFFHLGLLAGRPEIPAPPRRLHGVGNTDDGVAAACDGFWMPIVGLLDSVAAGAALGRIVDPLGNTVQRVHSPAAGVVALLRELPPVSAGDTLVLLAHETP